MSLIDNWTKIKDLLMFPDDNILYMFQVIKRRKDNPEMKSGTKVLDCIITADWEDEDLHTRLKRRVEIDNARVYFKLNHIEAHTVALRTMAKIANMIADGQYNINRCYESVCSEFRTGEVFWFADIDTKNVNLEALTKHLEIIQADAKRTPVVKILETPNGYHAVTRSFDPRKFTFPFEIKKNDPTILYANLATETGEENGE